MTGLGGSPEDAAAGRPGLGEAAGTRSEFAARPALRRGVDVAVERIQEILDTAERVAEDIRRDAEAEAERYLAERRREADRLVEARAKQLSDAAEAVRSRLRELEEQGAEMLHALERAVGETDWGRAGSPPPPTPPTPTPPLPVPEPPGADPGAHRDAPRAEARRVPNSEEPLLRATQMAVAGSGRDEIEATLRDEFQLSDPASIVDAILGPRAR